MWLRMSTRCTSHPVRRCALSVSGASLPRNGAGAISELVVSVITMPLEVVKNRMQLGANPNRATGGLVSSKTNYPSISAAFRTISRREARAAALRSVT